MENKLSKITEIIVKNNKETITKLLDMYKHTIKISGRLFDLNEESKELNIDNGDIHDLGDKICDLIFDIADVPTKQYKVLIGYEYHDLRDILGDDIADYSSDNMTLEQCLNRIINWNTGFTFDNDKTGMFVRKESII